MTKKNTHPNTESHNRNRLAATVATCLERHGYTDARDVPEHVWATLDGDRTRVLSPATRQAVTAIMDTLRGADGLQAEGDGPSQVAYNTARVGTRVAEALFEAGVTESADVRCLSEKDWSLAQRVATTAGRQVKTLSAATREAASAILLVMTATA